MNKYSYCLLNQLNWPKEILLLFETDDEAMKVLEVLFPNPELVEAEKLKIGVHIMAFSDLDWKFQLSPEGSRSFTSKPLRVIHKFKSEHHLFRVIQ